MRNLKKLLVIHGLTAVTATLMTLTACSSSSSKKGDERSEGRTVDDKNITENVRSRLDHDPVYKYHGVDVKTFGGIVQLSGFVNAEEQKRRAETLAQDIPGVSGVVNGIAIKPTPTGMTNEGSATRIYSE